MVLCRRPPPARSRVRTRGSGDAEGSVCPLRASGGVRLGRPLRLQGCSEGRRKGAGREEPEDIRPPATTTGARPIRG